MSLNTKSMNLAGTVGGAVSTAANIGAGDGVFAQLNGSILEFKSLVAGANITLTASATEIEIAATGVGEANTSSNVGSGEGLALPKVGVDLPFKSLIGETDRIILTGNANDVTFTLGSEVVLNNQANTYTTGNKQTVRHNATTAGLRVIPNTGNPSTQTDGDIWINNNSNKIFARISATDVLLNTNITTINFVIDGGGSVITTGIKGQVIVDFDCTIIEWAIIGLPAGAIVVDVNRSTFAGFPTTTSIAGTELPTITATNDTGEDRTLSSWSTINAGDILEFEVDSVATIERCTVALKCMRT